MRYIQDPKTLKLVPADEYYARKSESVDNNSFSIINDIDPFVSPVDRSVISSRSKLRSHNIKHGVTDVREYGDNWFKRKSKERDAELKGETREARKSRIKSIRDALQQYRG